MALRNLAAEIDRFSKENERLEQTEARLVGEVEFLGKKKNELTGHVDKLKGTVGELQNVSEGLQNELEQFRDLKGMRVLTSSLRTNASHTDDRCRQHRKVCKRDRSRCEEDPGRSE